MPKITIPQDTARELACGTNVVPYKVISNEIFDTSRWSIIYSLVIQNVETGKYYSSSYSRGATESQDESPFEYEDNPEFFEVEPVETTVVQYVQVKD